ncbi:MAG: substrate-binding domain-containing protein [Vicinamibacterales bacterium]
MRDAVMTRRLILLAALLAGSACRTASDAPPAPLRVFSSNGVRALLDDARPRLEQAAGRPLAIDYSTAAALRRRIEGGDVPDVAVLTASIVADLATQGRLAGDTRRDLARVGVGIGVRTGAPAADVGTADAVKALLLGARSVVFTAEGQSRATIDAAFEQLGIADAMRATSLLRGPGEAPGLVARGEAEVVLTLVSEIVEVPGVTLLGPFPPELQRYVTFSAARGTAAPDPSAADRLLAALAASELTNRLAAHGLEPPPPR